MKINEHHCMYCGAKISQQYNSLWVDTTSPIFPQYCPTTYDDMGNIEDARLHTPKLFTENKS